MIRRENIRLTVSNIIFHLEKSDFEMLSSYLNQAQQYFHSLPNGQKQFQDFEFNISEFLLDKLKEGAQYVTAEHVSEAMVIYGSFTRHGTSEEHQSRKDLVNKGTDISTLRRSISSQENFQKVILTVLSILGLSF